MTPTALIGSRIRDRRSQIGLRQGALAQTVGISATYLNLIEHNRRPVGGDLLARLAEALGLPAAALEAQNSILADLEPAVTQATGVKLERAEDFATRFPGWAALVAQQSRRIADLEGALGALGARMDHDPILTDGLHELLSAAAAVRSTAAILVDTPDLSPDWRARFERNLAEDSARLAQGAGAIAQALGGVQSHGTPQDEFEGWLAAQSWYLPAFEARPTPNVLAQLGAELSPSARALLLAWGREMTVVITAMPIRRFLAALAQSRDPAILAQKFATTPAAVYCRLAFLPPSEQAFGLLVADGSGTLVFRKPLEGFALPRFGGACSLWPIFTALARPAQPVEACLDVAGLAAAPLQAQAWAQIDHPQGFGGPPRLRSYMLLQQGAGAPIWPVGISCRICPRRGCTARREESLLPVSAD